MIPVVSLNMIPFLDFNKKYRKYKEPIHSAISRVFERGWFILGPELTMFEESFARYLDVKSAIGVNSGTDAIFLALKAHGVDAGSEVITVANTATPTVSAIRMTGATPVFVDVLRDVHTMDPAQIEKAISPKTRAIVPVHLFGYPANMEEIMRIAKRHRLSVIEDACQAHGAKYSGRMVGTLGDVGCFSFYPTKNLGAFGDAGAVVTNNAAIADKIRALRNYGEIAKYENAFEGVNTRLDEVQASLLNWSLEHLDEWNLSREKLAGSYVSALKDLPLELPCVGDSVSERVWHLFVVKSRRRDELQAFLKENAIETSIHYPMPIFAQLAYQFLGVQTSDFPVTNELSQDILSLPLYPELTSGEVSKICSTIQEFFS
jgi:dTDP-4-amino-4,6-dideoxygalactose transaminase